MAPTFQMGSARRSVVNFSAYARRSPTTPHAYSTRFRLFPFRSPLLRESHSLSFPRGTEMVHFPRLALSRPRWPGCPIRKPPDQRLLTSPRRISLFVASFIASWCQGILRRPLVAWPLYLSLDLCMSPLWHSFMRNHSQFNCQRSISPCRAFPDLPKRNSETGGDERSRTADPLLAKQMLYQLSYTP